MRIFFDSSALLAASGSTKGASYAVIQSATKIKWDLLTSNYCIAEVEKNLKKIKGSKARWEKKILPHLEIVEDAFTSRLPTLLAAGKDKPVLFSAHAASADYLLTVDTKDFELLLGTDVYGAFVTTPWEFLEEHWKEIKR